MIKLLPSYAFPLIIVSTLGLVACGGDSSGGSTTNLPASAVTNKTPEAFAVDVPLDTTVTAQFDRDILAMTVDSSSFRLANSDAVAGTVNFDESTNVATFTPGSNLSINSTYTASLGTSITDLSGNSLATDYRWSFTTVDGAWDSTELLETEPGLARSPQIAMNDSGEALAVWYQADGAFDNIWANYFDGAAWVGGELLEIDSGDASAPRVAIDDSGNALAVWAQSDGSVTNIRSARYQGGSWSTPELLEDDNTGDAQFPKIAMDGGGNALAVWQQYDGTVYNIWASYFDGANWSAAVQLESDNVGDAIAAQVALDDAGNAIAVWRQFDGAVFNIWANRFDGSSWSVAQLLEFDNAGDAVHQQIGFDDNGNALAIWSQSDGSVNSIRANYFNGASWQGAVQMVSDDTESAYEPQFGFDGSGNAIAVWYQYDGYADNIWANYFDGNRWGDAELVDAADTGDHFEPHIVTDSSGNALAVWRQTDGGPYSIWACRFDGASWGIPELLENDDTGDAIEPRIGIDGAGNAIAVWRQLTAGVYSIWSKRFD